jgi:hypothetical protein
MPEPRVITLQPRVPVETLERAVLRLDLRKYPRRAEVIHFELAQRRAEERAKEWRRAA